MLEKTLESPLDSKEIKPVNPKGKQLWIFIGRTDAEAEAPILWAPDVKSRLIRKNPDAGKDWIQEREYRGYRGWDGWMASLTQCTWVWANSRRWWKTGEPGVLQSMGSQRLSGTWQRNQTITMELTVSPMKSETVNYHFNSFVLGHCNGRDI